MANILLDTFSRLHASTVRSSPHLDEDEFYKDIPCGLHKAPLAKACNLLPQLADVLREAPVPAVKMDEYVVDVKIHFLMNGQYPCNPNWHCDGVPRTNGEIDYFRTSTAHSMFLWVSDFPCTQYICREDLYRDDIANHKELADSIAKIKPKFTHVEPMYWYSFSQLSPHRGVASDTDKNWRVFIRVSKGTPRPEEDWIRRHSQVYLDAANFSW